MTSLLREVGRQPGAAEMRRSGLPAPPDNPPPHAARPGAPASAGALGAAARSGRRRLCWRWVRQGNVPSTREWRPRWLLGLVEVVTHPRPHWRARRVRFVPGCREIPGFPARAPFLVPIG